MIVKKTYIPSKPRSKKLVNAVSGGSSIAKTDLNQLAGDSHKHSNLSIIEKLTQGDIDVLEKLSIVDGALQIDISMYSTGEVSAYGRGQGGGGGGGSGGGDIDMLDSWANYTTAKANYYVPSSLLVPFRNDTLSRLTSLESGSATSITTTGSGNAITSLTKSGSVITATKGLSFALSTHTHSITDITGLQGALDSKQPTIPTGATSQYFRGDKTWQTLNTSVVSEGTNLYFTNARVKAYGDTLYSLLGHTHTIAQITGLQGALDLKATQSDINTAIGGIEIGGRSIAINTSAEWKPLSWINWYWTGNFINYTEAKPNETYTISIHLRNVEDSLDGAVRLWVYWLNEEGVEVGYSYNGSLVYDEGISEATFTIPEGRYGFKASIRGTQRDSTKSCEYRMFKAEKGNKATDWTPAPEDQVTDWNVTDVNSFAFLKNKPTQLSQFTDNIGVATHIANKANPHAVTKAQVGLGNADNTSDANKPVSTATQTALNLKVNKAGDTMTGSLTMNFNNSAPITLTRDNQVGIFFNNTLAPRYLGVDINGVLRYGTLGDHSSNYYVYHSGNFNPANYLPLTGGTLTGNLTAPTFIGALTGNASTATKLQTARTIASVSFDGSANIAIPFANLASKPTTLAGYGITDAVNTTSNQTVVGVKTFQDELRTPTLHLSRKGSNITAEEAAGWYRVAESTGGGTASAANIILFLDRGYNQNTNESYSFSISIAHGGGVNISQLSGKANIRLISKIRVNYVSTTPYKFYVDFYYNGSGGLNTYYASGMGYALFQAPTRIDDATGYFVEFDTVDGAKASSYTGTLTGNATTATTLQTARTLWGQSFNGSANISGNMTGVGSIAATASNTITATTTEAYFRVTNPSCTIDLITSSTSRGLYDRSIGYWIIRSNGTNTSMGVGNVGLGIDAPTAKLHVYSSAFLGLNIQRSTAAGSSILFSNLNGDLGKVGFDVSGNLRVDTGSGTSGTGAMLSILANGSVGIGTTAPTSKLHVVGDIYATTKVKSPILDMGNNWTMQAVGNEIHIMLNGVVKFRFLEGGFVSTGEITAYA